MRTQCDGCHAARAQWSVTVHHYGVLYLCGHHFRKHLEYIKRCGYLFEQLFGL